jgi:transglutaminase-like putative cysteine protease
MTRSPAVLLAASMALCGLTSGCSGEAPAEAIRLPPVLERELRVRHFELTYRAEIAIPEGAERVEVWLPYPSSDAHQEVTVTEIAAPWPMTVHREPEYGNRILYMLGDGPHRRVVTVEMTMEVERREVLRHGDLLEARLNGDFAGRSDLARWLAPDRLVPLDERIRTLSREVTSGARSDLGTFRAIYDHVVDTMEYSKEGTGWGRGDIYWACDARRGNCTDFHALFTGLSRAAGIPAKFAIGFPIPESRGSGEVAGYHCWSELYLDGVGWVPVDASEAAKHPELREYYFGGHDENRVELSQGRDLVLAPPQRGEPLNFFVYPYVEIDGELLEEVELVFHYRDLPGM